MNPSIYNQLLKYISITTFTRKISNNIYSKLGQSYNFACGDIPLVNATVGQLLDVAADQNGDKISFGSAHQDIAKTYTEFSQEVNKIASGLLSLGLQKGDKVAIYSPNCYEWPVVQYAAAKAGLVLVNINPAYQAAELEYCLKKVRCKAVFSWDELKTQDFYSIFCNIMPELPKQSVGKISSKNLPHLERIIMFGNKQREGTITFNDVLNAGNAESKELLGKIEKTVQFDDPVNIQFTSGTTGNPKAAVLTHHNIVNNALLSGRRTNFHLNNNVVACCQVPMFHCFGSVFASLSAVIYQNSCIYPSKIFSAKETLKAIEKYNCTVVYGTPTMFMDLLHKYRELRPNVKSLNQAVIGGASCPEALVRGLRSELNISQIMVAYGSTENSPAVAGTRAADDFELSAKGILPPFEYIEMKVVDDKGSVVPINMQGELCIRGHAVFVGYFEDQEKTDEVLEKTRWYHSGDLASMDEDGYIRIVGRKKDMVIRGGENLFPAEIENFLHTHPAILEAQVVGVPDERMGEELCAWICLKKGESLTEEALRKFCHGKISHFKIPRYIMFVEDFPRTESGKIKKYEMKKISKEKLNL